MLLPLEDEIFKTLYTGLHIFEANSSQVSELRKHLNKQLLRYGAVIIFSWEYMKLSSLVALNAAFDSRSS